MNVAILLTLATAVLCAKRQDEPSSLESFNATEVIQNDITLKLFMRCFIDEGECKHDSAGVKKMIPDAVTAKCANCTAKQSQAVRAVLAAGRAMYPEMWDVLIRQYDPSGEFTASFDQFLEGKESVTTNDQ